MSDAVEVVHFTDPACPWAYSAEPFMRALEWRYGDALQWRTVLIGLSEDTSRAIAGGWTAHRQLMGWQRFGRRFGMPFGRAPRPRPIFSGLACRAVVAAGRQSQARALELLRAFRFAWFTTALLLDTDDGVAEIAGSIDGIDVDRLLRDLHSDEVEADYQAGREETRAAERSGLPAIAQAKTARTDGPERFTAPSIVFRRSGQSLVAGGWQPLHAYDVCLANLAPDLERRDEPTPAELLPAYPGGLTTQEVARVCAVHDDDPDREGVLHALAELASSGRARRVPLANDALWLPT